MRVILAVVPLLLGSCTEDAFGYYHRRSHCRLAARVRPCLMRVLAGPDWLGNLGCVATARQILLSHCLLDPVHLVLIALAVPHSTFLGLLEGRFQHLDPLHGCAQPLLQLGQLAAQIRIVSHLQWHTKW